MSLPDLGPAENWHNIANLIYGVFDKLKAQDSESAKLNGVRLALLHFFCRPDDLFDKDHNKTSLTRMLSFKS